MKKWSMNEKWFGARITGPSAGTLSARDAARAEEDPRVQRGHDAHDLVDPVRVARARALVEPIEVLGGTRVLVDLRPSSGRASPAVTSPRSFLTPNRANAPAPRCQPSSSDVALVLAHARLVARALAPDARTWSSVQAARRRRRPGSAAPSAVVSATSGTTTGTPSTSAWNCISQRLTVAAAVGAQLGQRLAAAAPPSRARRRPSGRPSPPSAARARCARVAAAREPDDRAARVRVPVRRAEPGQRGHEVDAVVGLQRAGQLLGLGRRLDDPEPVAQPLDGGAGDEDRRLERVGGRAPICQATVESRPSRRGGALVPALSSTNEPVPYVFLPSPGSRQRLAEERGLLVAGDAGDRDLVAVERLGACGPARRSSAAPRAASAPGRRTARSSSSSQPPAADVEQQRARRVGRVGDVLAGELEQQPGVDRPEHRPALARALARARRRCAAATRSSSPRSTGRAPGPVRSRTRVLVARPRAARRSAPAVRRSCQTSARCSGSPVAGSQQHDGLALVGDADRLELARPDAGVVERLAGHGVRDVPDLGRVVLDPARPREVLAELAVGAADQLALAGRRPGRSCRSSPGRSRAARAAGYFTSLGS